MRDSPHPFAFIPVPLERARRDGWTPMRQARFILTLARIGCVAAAARAVGRSRRSAYALRHRTGGDSFAAAWDRALDHGQMRVRDVAITRALRGETRPVYQGRQIGTRTYYNDGLIMAVLRRFPPVVDTDFAAFTGGKLP